MTEDLLQAHAHTTRRVAAELIREQARPLEDRWRAILDELLAAYEAGLRVSLVSTLGALPGWLAYGIETADEGWLADKLWQLADHTWRCGMPYPGLSRAFRQLKRLLNAVAEEHGQLPVPLADIHLLFEDVIDICRLRVSGFHHVFAEEKLREGEQLTRYLLNHIHDAVLVVDLDSRRVRYANAAASRLLGYRAADLLSRGFLELCVPEHRQAVNEALLGTVAGGGVTTRFEGPGLLNADGEPLNVGMRFLQVRHDQPLRLVQVLVNEITDSASDGVASEDEQYRLFLESFARHTADAVIVIDLDNHVQFWNEGAGQIFGYTADEMLNESMLKLLPPETGAQELRQLNALVDRDGFVRNAEGVRIAKDGRAIHCNITRTALYSPVTQTRLGTSVVLRDVTDKRRMEQELSSQARQLRIINRILEATSRTLDRSTTYRTIAAQIDDVLPCDVLTLSLPYTEDGSLRVRVLKGDANYEADAERLVRREDSLRAEVFYRHSPLRVDDLRAVIDLRPDDQQLVDQGYRSVLATPLVYDQEVIGTLMLADRQAERYTADDEQLLERLSGHFAVILENARRFEEERKRSAQFELINRVGAAAIANIGDVGRLLHSTVAAIQRDFGYHDVAMYEVDDNARVFRLRAHAGERRGDLGEGFEQSVDHGVFGEVLRSGSSYVAHDVSVDPLYVNPVGAPPGARSEMCVPIRVGPRVMGVLDVESEQPNAFDPLDQAAMEALAGLLARCMQADETLRQMRMFQALRRHIMEAVPSALLLLDEELRVQFVNRRYLEFFGQSVDEIHGQHYTDVFPPSLVYESEMPDLIEELKDHLAPIDKREVRYFDFSGAERVADVRMRIVTEYQTNIVVMLHDATGRMARLYQLQMLREIGEEMQRILDLDRLLRAILTCITAGPGFGFNRAALFLLDRDKMRLTEMLTVGPGSVEEAGRVWREVSHRTTLTEFLRAYEGPQPAQDRSVRRRAIQLVAGDEGLESWRTPLRVRHDQLEGYPPVAAALWQFSGAPEVVVVPLVSQGNVSGVIVADNLYSGEPIDQNDINTLAVFANQAGVAMGNAQAFETLEDTITQLREAQRQLVLVERLAGVGRVARNVAHEIRNPLVSIGGFARRAVRKADDPATVRHCLGIVIEEVQRLERILKNVMDFTAPGKPQISDCDLNQLVRDVLASQQPVFEEHRIAVDAHLSGDLPVTHLDQDKIKQVVLNLVRNAVQAMEHDGRLVVTSAVIDEDAIEVIVQDSGPGVPEDKIVDIFSPFYTKKADGTGLGLAVSHKMVVDHGGTLTCESKLGDGARFIMRLPRDASAAAAETGSES